MLTVVCGCAGKSTAPPPAAPPPAVAPAPVAQRHEADDDPNVNPVALRLHDLAGPLLEYFAVYRQFPAALEDLRTARIVSSDAVLTDPSSGLRFAYTPDGPTVPGYTGRLLASQSDRSDPRGVWVLLVSQPKGARHWIAEVHRVAPRLMPVP
ncbi:MAG: hypothetical protein WD042_07690 [Phycisphaeraceae bacterium]